MTTNTADWRFRVLQDLEANGKRTVDPDKEGKQKNLKTNENTPRARTSRSDITGSSTAMGADRKELAMTWRLMDDTAERYGRTSQERAEGHFWRFMNGT